ncbi:hypothetical protein LDFHOB_04690 [Candidatus Electronema aureum]
MTIFLRSRSFFPPCFHVNKQFSISLPFAVYSLSRRFLTHALLSFISAWSRHIPMKDPSKNLPAVELPAAAQRIYGQYFRILQLRQLPLHTRPLLQIPRRSKERGLVEMAGLHLHSNRQPFCGEAARHGHARNSGQICGNGENV